jgi:hypothetical protein
MYADDFLQPWYESARELVPGASLFDIHTHVGSNDPDGFKCRPDALIAALELVDGRAAVFPMHEPDGYPPWNDWVIDEAAKSDGRLVAFCRLDPRDGPVAEAERALDRGAVGIKLHPRAEAFRLFEPEWEGIYAVAHERSLPLIVHAGRGIPALGRDAVDLAGRYPDMKLILAHEGICDLAWIWRHAQELPNLFFDTAWWSPADHLSLFAYVPPGQILFGSDAPYGTPLQAQVQITRYGLQAGLTGDQMVSVLGGQAARLIAGEPAVDLGPAPGPEGGQRVDLLLERVQNFLIQAFSRYMSGESGEESIALARLSCEVGEETPESDHAGSILALIDRHVAYQETSGAAAETEIGRRFPGLHLLLTASCIARTPSVPAPVPDPEDLAERQRG